MYRKYKGIPFTNDLYDAFPACFVYSMYYLRKGDTMYWKGLFWNLLKNGIRERNGKDLEQLYMGYSSCKKRLRLYIER